MRKLKRFLKSNPTTDSNDPSYFPHELRIDKLKKLNYNDIFLNIQEMLEVLHYYSYGYMMTKTSKFSNHEKILFDLIKEANEPYISKENRKIFRGVIIEKEKYLKYCTTNFEKTYLQTSLIPIQSWSYSKKFVEDWIDENIARRRGNYHSRLEINDDFSKYLQIVYETNTLKNHKLIMITPKSILIYFSKLYKWFPSLYYDFENEINEIISYFNSHVNEVVIYSENNEVFVDKVLIRGC